MPHVNDVGIVPADLLHLTTQLVVAYVGNNNVEQDRVPQIIRSVYASLVALNGQTELTAKARQKPAVPINKSITPDYLICLEDGKKLKMLKRHLRALYGMSPDDYRAKWGLPPAYPMVAPNYAEQRSVFAKNTGLGTRRKLPNK